MFEPLRVASVVLLAANAFAIGFLLVTHAVRKRNLKGSAAAFVAFTLAALILAGQLVEDPVLEPLWLQHVILAGGGLIAGLVGALLLVALSRWSHGPRRHRRPPMGGGAAAAWRDRWEAVIASDVSNRDGIGWEFIDEDLREVWVVFREDGGPFPVFSAARGDGALPRLDDLEAMTREAVADLLAAGGWTDDHGWITKNISAALLLASSRVTGWEGEEWALESGADDEPLEWAASGSGRTPLLWLRALGADRDIFITTYQDDDLFGLNFLWASDRPLPESDTGSLRSRSDLPLLTGPINKVEVVFDTTVHSRGGRGMLSEVLLHGETSSSLLIAAEAYSRDDWRLYDESVVVLPDATTADMLDWHPPRRKWRPTQTPGR